MAWRGGRGWLGGEVEVGLEEDSGWLGGEGEVCWYGWWRMVDRIGFFLYFFYAFVIFVVYLLLSHYF